MSLTLRSLTLFSLALFSLDLFSVATGEFVCDMWLAPSLIDGKGIFAGRSFTEGDDLDYAPSVPVPYHQIRYTMLASYVHAGPTEYLLGHPIEYSLVNFGMTMIMNHHSPPTRTYAFHEDESDEYSVNVNETLTHPYTAYPVTWHGTEVDMQPADEIFNLYSWDGSWFEDKGLVMWDDTNDTNSQNKPSLEHIEENGHCMTQVYFNVSDILRAGLGIFASRDFKKGEDVTVSPVLVLPRTEIEEMYYTSVLQNYCIAGEESEVVLLPIGMSVIANHALHPNMEMTWHEWKTHAPGKLNATLSQNISSLVESKFTSLDVVFRATRDIFIGEELTIDYGESWVNAYATYLADYAVWLTSNNHEEGEEGNVKNMTEENGIPLFRHFIAPPAGMFPTSWDYQYETIDVESDAEKVQVETEGGRGEV